MPETTNDRPILPEREGKLPPIPNDPGHPLRRFAFAWHYNSHIDGRTWYGDTHRDEYHGIERIHRSPRSHRRRVKHNAPMGVRYRFDGDPYTDDALTYDEMIARLRERGLEYAGRLLDHPLVDAWQRGEEIEWEPAEPPFPVSSVVGYESEPRVAEAVPDLAEKQRQRRYEVVEAHGLFSKLQRIGAGDDSKPKWVPNRRIFTPDPEAP